MNVTVEGLKLDADEVLQSLVESATKAEYYIHGLGKLRTAIAEKQITARDWQPIDEAFEFFACSLENFCVDIDKPRGPAFHGEFSRYLREVRRAEDLAGRAKMGLAIALYKPELAELRKTLWGYAP